MNLQELHDLYAAGRFREALEAMESRQWPVEERLRWLLLGAELYERTGQFDRGRAAIERLLKREQLEPAARSRCELCLALIEMDCGEVNDAIIHFQRAVSLAERSKDPALLSWAQLRLAVLLAGREGPSAITPLIAKARDNATKAGDTRLTAAFHIFVAEIEAKRGLIQSATRHTLLGQKLLVDAPSPWLEAVAENNQVALAVMRSDFERGLVHAERALQLANDSGAAAIRRACLGNLGNLCCALGDTERGVNYLLDAAKINPRKSHHTNACLDSIAKAHLAKGELTAAERCLKEIRDSIRTSEDMVLYEHRDAQLTRVQLLCRQRKFEEALSEVQLSIDLNGRAGDQLLTSVARIAKADILRELGRQAESIEILRDLTPRLSDQTPDVHARYERAIAGSLIAAGENEMASAHLARARRIYSCLHNSLAQSELEHTVSGSLRVEEGAPLSTSLAGKAALAHSVGALFLDVARPELAAYDLFSIVVSLGCASVVTLSVRDRSGTTRHWAEHRASAGCHAGSRTFEIGSMGEDSVILSVAPYDDVKSAVLMNSISLLVEMVHELQRARAEHEERLTLWPLEEEPEDDGDGIILGHMRELMTFAKRVAKTNISVLITGESGTGKEIVARAIHKYSTRADRPFMPFNCTAIPRDMLESQLFGHRRGAFTSADRDNPGLIRAARGGTLFLDEIGELGMDLQPKLLRFLESGEISPLGDTGPITVDVRIIAATNRDLEELVRAERFREDLFYRLNVIRLTILPLRERRDEIPALLHHFVARSARDLGKGQLRIAEETMERFLLYPWPGNVRQLQNEVRRIVALADVDGVLTPDMLSADIRKAGPRGSARRDGHEVTVPITDKLSPAVAHVERELIRAALKKTHGRVDAAAKVLGISRKGLYLKRQRLGI